MIVRDREMGRHYDTWAIAILGVLSAAISCSAAVQAINESKIRAHTQFLADDMLGGRGVGSEGEELAIRYVAAQFQAMGLSPGGEHGSYFQKVPLVATKADPSMTLSFRIGNKTMTARYGEEIIANTPLQEENVTIRDKELVFVGYGIQAPEYEWDDFKDADVKDKVLLFLNNDPNTDDPEFFGGKARLYYGRWTYKFEMAAQMGAAGAIIIHTTPSAGYPWAVIKTWTGEQFALPLSEPKVKVEAWITEDRIREILASAGTDLQTLYDAAQRREFRPVPLGIEVSIDIQSTVREMAGTNVLGLLPGRDPQLKDEVVIFTAHSDHLGIGEPVEGDSIYNGALDNASGVASIITLAEAFTRLPTAPRRSILFMAVTAEESGLLGSAYYAAHPTFPPGKIAANFNVDGINIYGPTRDVVILGLKKSDLGTLFTEAAHQQGRTALADQMPEQGLFYRCDHFSFAKIGVPCCTLDQGLDAVGKPQGWMRQQIDAYIENHYHQPSDEYDPDWNLQGAVTDLQLFFQVALKVANQEQMPHWTPGDEFEALRK
ncbi:MAG: M28 family peptidase [Phycisphaerales bacterium]|nr:MAG: M28 family peptidase [Phycisphaerales bacterium]